MLSEFLTFSVQVIVLAPLILLFIRRITRLNLIRITLFFIIFLVYKFFLILPNYYEGLIFFKSDWGWTGKIYGIIVGLISYFLFKNYFAEYDYFTLRQKTDFIRSTVVASISIVILATVIHYALGEAEFDVETLLYQLTMPGIGEEIIYRGIFLGLLMSVLKRKIMIGRLNLGSPAVLTTAVLFSLVHALHVSADWQLVFNWISFVRAGFAGYIWGWIAIKSCSLLQPILSHNLSNFFGSLATMIK